MKALSALRTGISLKKNEELGRKISPEELKRIVRCDERVCGIQAAGTASHLPA